MICIYCEPGGYAKKLKKIFNNKIEIKYFPYDSNSYARIIQRDAVPSGANWEEINLKLEEIFFPFDTFNYSEKYQEIKRIVGGNNRMDILHIDSAYKSNCSCFITRDKGDILKNALSLEKITGIKFFHPEENFDELVNFINELINS